MRWVKWFRSALMNSWCYTITNGVRGISLSRRIFHNTPVPLSNASLVAKETPVRGRQRPLSFLSFFSRRDSHYFASRRKGQNYEKEEIESNRFNKQKKKKERKLSTCSTPFVADFVAVIETTEVVKLDRNSNAIVVLRKLENVRSTFLPWYIKISFSYVYQNHLAFLQLQVSAIRWSHFRYILKSNNMFLFPFM